MNNMKMPLSKIKIITIKYIKNIFGIFHLLIISILIIPTNLYSLTIVIKYKGNKDQKLTTCGTSDGCSTLPSYYYTKNLKEQTEYINNQLVYIAEIQWNNNLDDCRCMFSECVNIISINLNNFDTSICTDMTAMFRGCTSLISIDLTNFQISSATHLGQMFRECSSLTSLDLSSFRGTNVKYMDYVQWLFFISSY